MPPTIAVNQQRLSDLGVDLAIPSRFHVPPRTVPTVELSGRLGALLAGPARRTARILPMQGRLVQTSAAAREAAEADLEDLLGGAVVLQTDNGLGTVRELVGLTTKLEFTPRPSWFAGVNSEFVWELLCPDPTWRSPAPVHRVLPAGVRVPIPIGTLPAPWRILVYGPTAATWTVTFRRANGEVVATLTASGTGADLAATAYVDLDGGAETAVKVDSGGAATNFLPRLAGDFPPAGISPEDGWRALGLYPTVELSDGVGEYWGEERWGR